MTFLTESEIDNIILKQNTFFASHRTKSISFRKNALNRLLAVCEKYEEAYPKIDYKLGIVVVEAFKEFYEYKKEAQKSALTKNLMEASDREREKLLNEMFGNDERAKADMRRILKGKFLAATNNDKVDGFDDGG